MVDFLWKDWDWILRNDQWILEMALSENMVLQKLLCFRKYRFSPNKIANLESIWEENTYRWLIGVTISMTIYHVWGKHQLLVQSNSVYSSGADGVPEVWNPTHGLIGHPEAGADLLTWECSMWLPHEIHWYSMHLKVPMLGCSKNVEHCGKRAL